MQIIGFDVSKKELVGVRVNKRSDVQERYVVANDETGINIFLDSLECTVTIGCEATAEYHNLLALSCIRRDIPFIILNPIVTKQFTRATVRKRKTDLTDAHVIAKCILQGEGERATEASFSVAKRMLRTSSELSRLAVSVRHMRLTFEDHWSQQTDIQQELSALAQTIETSMRRIRTLGLEQTDEKLKGLLVSVPGIGDTLAATIISEIGDVKRFTNVKAVVAYAGLDPKVRQSGTTLQRNTKLTKRGSPYLRRALYIAASIAQRHDRELKVYYLKKRTEGKRYKEATVANARHILQRVYAVWKRGTPYVVHS